MTSQENTSHTLEMHDSDHAAGQVVELLAEALNCIGADDGFARKRIEQALVAVGGRVEQTPATGGLAPWQKVRVAAYIEAHLTETLKIEQIALLVPLTANYFSRAFKTSFGEPFSQYLITRRIERAKTLLLATELPISEIAVECGLSDQSHLSRLFRRNVGAAPAAWRRRHGGPRQPQANGR